MTEDLKFIASSVTDGVMILNKELKITYFSEPAADLIGLSCNRAQGLYCFDVFKELLPIAVNGSLHLSPAEFSDALNGLELSVTLSAGIKRFFHFNAKNVNDEVFVVFTNLSKSKEFDELRKDFMDSMSHELRTPISTIKTYAATLSHPKADFNREMQCKFLDIIDSEANKLTRIVDSIFEASKMSKYRLTLKYESVDLAQLLNEAIDSVTIPQTHEISLSVLTEEKISGDKEQLLYAFIHVISNAVKFSPEGGNICIEITEEGQKDCILVSISDDGIGIPFDLQEKIFEAFFKVDIGTTKKIYSVGMGLFIIKKIIEAHSGRLWVESQIGKGSKFLFLLPKNIPFCEVDPSQTQE